LTQVHSRVKDANVKWDQFCRFSVVLLIRSACPLGKTFTPKQIKSSQHPEPRCHDWSWWLYSLKAEWQNDCHGCVWDTADRDNCFTNHNLPNVKVSSVVLDSNWEGNQTDECCSWMRTRWSMMRHDDITQFHHDKWDQHKLHKFINGHNMWITIQLCPLK